MKTESFDLVIVGGGIVGCSLALALSGSGLTVALVDRQSLQPEHSSTGGTYSARVCAINEASLRLFKRLGAWELMVSRRVAPFQHMRVWDRDGTGHIELDAATAGVPRLGHIVENGVIRDALLEKLVATDTVLYAGQEVTQCQLGEPHRLTLDDSFLNAKLLVATDGANSELRKCSGIPANQRDYRHHAIVASVETELSHQNTAWQVFMESGPLAFLPLPDQDGRHFCSIVWSLVPRQAARVMQLDDASFAKELERSFESRLGSVRLVSDRMRFPLTERHARQYQRNRVVLAGDAAHTIHPLAGQGVNLGLQDVVVLAGELNRAVGRGEHFFADHLLRRYERKRMGSNLLMMRSMRLFQELFAADSLGVRWLRNSGLDWVNRLNPVKERLIHHALGI